MPEQLKKVRHDYIRYANCWEDADLLLDGLDIQSGDRVLSIGSAGDNSFSLLTCDPALVVAVDINPVQLQLIALKKAAFQALAYPEFLQFLGFVPSGNRMELFQKVKVFLSADQYSFWTDRKDEIEDGLIFQGKFERYFEKFRSRILPMIHSKEEVHRLFADKNAEEQKNYFDKKWNTWRWRMLFRVFFSKFVMGRLGRDPKFLKEVKTNVSAFILGRANNQLETVQCQYNYFLQFILKGNFGGYLPHYAREKNYEKIKTNVDRLVIFNGLAEDAFQEYQNFNKFNLSNIFEYMNKPAFEAVRRNLIDHGTSGARYAYWNLMVPRRMSYDTDRDGDNTLIFEEQLSAKLSKKDKGFFYANFIIDVKR